MIILEQLYITMFMALPILLILGVFTKEVRKRRRLFWKTDKRLVRLRIRVYLPDKHIHYISTELIFLYLIQYRLVGLMVWSHFIVIRSRTVVIRMATVRSRWRQQRVTFILIPRHLQHTGGEH